MMQKKRKNAENFLQLYHSEWNDRISLHALATLDVNKYNKPRLVPLVQDLAKLHSYLETKSVTLAEEMQVDLACYPELAEVCLVQIILFNRKRSGEAERIKLSEYKEALHESPRRSKSRGEGCAHYI